MREFIRHPTSIPFKLRPLDSEIVYSQNTLNNVSIGGVSCFCAEPIDIGTSVKLSISCVKPSFDITGKVVWCHEKQNKYETGIEFIASEDKLFLLRMVEQVCHIEHYRQEILLKENREITSEQAANEWIEKYADKFPTA